MRDDYIIVKLNYSDENKNEELLSGYPDISGYPHIFVLETDGSLLHSQDTAKLEQGKGYDPGVFLEFLKTWKLTPAEN